MGRGVLGKKKKDFDGRGGSGRGREINQNFVQGALDARELSRKKKLGGKKKGEGIGRVLKLSPIR